MVAGEMEDGRSNLLGLVGVEKKWEMLVKVVGTNTRRGDCVSRCLSGLAARMS